MSDMFTNIPAGLTLLCGWNDHAVQIVKELEAEGRPIAVICAKRPDVLKDAAFPVIEGDCADETTLKRAGAETAAAAIVLAEGAGRLPAGTVDARSILTALAVESLRPQIYSVLELINPENARHARRAHADSVIFCSQIIARFIALCASQRGISGFAADMFSRADGKSKLSTMSLDASWAGKTVGEAFAAIRAKGDLPLAVLRRGEDDGREEWRQEINPPANTPVELPMKVIYIACEKK